jgi:hypothetical protein
MTRSTTKEILYSFESLADDEKRSVAEEISRRIQRLGDPKDEDIWAGVPPIIAEIRRAFHAEPFQAFVLHLSDGRALLVEDNMHIAIAPYGKRVSVAVDRTFEEFRPEKIERVEVLASASR